MRPIKYLATFAVILSCILFLIPSLLVLPFSQEKNGVKIEEETSEAPEETAPAKGPEPEVAVYRSQEKAVEKIPLEKYVTGVVASEMPADFEQEALKAQALSARTYIVSHLMNGQGEDVPANADVTDTVNHQVYKSRAELKELWGQDYEWKMKKVAKAVKETSGEVLTYQKKPITASFFSTSNGYTENAEDYWDNPVPYLKSVASPWDSQSPKFTDQKVISAQAFQQKLGVTLQKGSDMGTITARTPGKKVAAVKIGGKEFTGREIREKLDLKSTDFSWEKKGSSIIITTKGFGHGVGMSQYGANGMAKEGKKYKEIVAHYYQDIEISEAGKLFEKQVASNQ